MIHRKQSVCSYVCISLFRGTNDHFMFFFLLWQSDAMNKSLQLASREQKKADESVLRLVEEHQVYSFIAHYLN